MTRVLALDPAKRTGYAVVDGSDVLTCGSWNLLDGVKETGKTAPPLHVRHVLAVQAMRRSVRFLCDRFRPDAVLVEREFGRGVGGRFLVALFVAAHEAALDAGLPCLETTVGEWRKAIHGSSKGSTDHFKCAALLLCAEAGVDVSDTDAAEAVLIGRFGVSSIRIKPAAAPATTKRKRAA